MFNMFLFQEGEISQFFCIKNGMVANLNSHFDVYLFIAIECINYDETMEWHET
jgi:hypothetical protein